MLFPKTNIEKKLTQLKNKQFNPSIWEKQVESIFEREEKKDHRILKTLEKGTTSETNDFIFDNTESSKIYHIDQIKKICVDYRLRFLDTKYFKGKLPQEAISQIKELEKTHNTELKGFKIIAPSKLFKLANADDPLLFAPMGNDYYYLIHKWGDDLHPFRKIMMWFFKSFENLLILTFLVSLLVTFMVPQGLFSKESNTSEFIMIFFFMFKSVAAVVLFYGFALGKNFNTAIWDSKYFNA
ncbi:hypothetical protein J8L88_21145 [Aquimarina sp. MMG015]|uniref:hypothetical protein n=1 Tax=unclassified Aquimarina TaxID=2627091 RepID=UPI000E4F8EAE|nr:MULTISPECIES: hypothetical protein [unclassified Aquimarina]AXT55796.1 hypothetical protein D1815_08555 [Aquimarina sp. AD1]MBQ4805381.1 hypothetical protein [Aquimarina sp. MMG015]RKN18574.1 hypothetical protein D7035_14150 [Aquimarina sp. AD1]